MSSVQATTYDYPVPVTKSDTAADPAGPFTGLYIDTGGILKFTPYMGPQANGSLTMNVTAGQYVFWPVSRVWNTTTTAVVWGLISPIIKQGANPT